MEKINKIKCLVVDDEPIARKIIKNYIDQISFLEFAAACKSGIEAIEMLNQIGDVQLVFLDINMPNLNGLATAKIMKNNILIIFTTAYSDYAVASYEVNAIDYLLKPFSLDRFAAAVFKASDQLKKDIDRQIIPEISNERNRETIFIKSDGKNYPVYISDVLYCEAMKNYTKIALLDGKILKTLATFTKIENQLKNKNSDILRIHRSFLVSKSRISSMTSNNVFIGKLQLPIGLFYKSTVLKIIGIK